MCRHNANSCSWLQEQGRGTTAAGIRQCRDMLLASGAKNKSGLVSERGEEWEYLRYGVPAVEEDTRKMVTDYEEWSICRVGGRLEVRAGCVPVKKAHKMATECGKCSIFQAGGQLEVRVGWPEMEYAVWAHLCQVLACSEDWGGLRAVR